MSEEPRKRSRFDQTEDPRRSRFDRRSRSPERSPVVTSVESPASADKNKKDPEAAAAAAAAAAAKINAQIQARKASQPVDVPPVRSVCSNFT